MQKIAHDFFISNSKSAGGGGRGGLHRVNVGDVFLTLIIIFQTWAKINTPFLDLYNLYRAYKLPQLNRIGKLGNKFANVGGEKTTFPVKKIPKAKPDQNG